MIAVFFKKIEGFVLDPPSGVYRAMISWIVCVGRNGGNKAKDATLPVAAAGRANAKLYIISPQRLRPVSHREFSQALFCGST